MEPAPRRDTATFFRKRLDLLIARSGLSASAFAREAGIDRSTLSQLLDGGEPRLPRADTLVSLARTAKVSTDWLLGLSAREEMGAEIIQAMLQIEEPDRRPADDQFVAWLREAEGYRVRTVPVTLPDFVKTAAVLQLEYGQAKDTPHIDAVQARLNLMASPDSDVEVCVSLQALWAFAAGADVWHGLSLAERIEQLERLRALYASAYPGLRLYLFDRRTAYSAPFTVFGPKRAVVYLGPSYLVFNGSDHIRVFARRFDDLIRRASVQPHAIDALLATMIEELRATAEAR